MGSESELVLHLWETFKDVIPAGKREDTANKMLKVLGDWGVELEEIANELLGEDSYLDKALEHFIESDDDTDDYDSDDEDKY